MNRKTKIDDALQEVSDAFGVILEREFMPAEHDFEVKIRLAQIPYPHGFNIKIYDDYLNWKIELQLDTFAAPLINFMQTKYNLQKDTFFSYLHVAQSKNNELSFLINNQKNLSDINEEWKELDFSVIKSYYSEAVEFSSLTAALLDFMCIVLFLIIDNEEWTENIEIGKEEGDSYLAEVTKYERSRFNRAICLKYYGFTCRGCGEILEQKYGPIGSNVIHVHHIVPVSQMQYSYRLNPIKDLIPLCPNCHNIVHRVNPPLKISELNILTKYTPS